MMRRAFVPVLALSILVAVACSTFGGEDEATPPGDDGGAATDGAIADGVAEKDGDVDVDGGPPECSGATVLQSDLETIPDPDDAWQESGNPSFLKIDDTFKKSGAASLQGGPVTTERGRLLGRRAFDAGVPKPFCLRFDHAIQVTVPPDAGGYVDTIQVDLFPVPSGGGSDPHVYIGIGVDAKGSFLNLIDLAGKQQFTRFDLGSAKAFHSWTILVEATAITAWADGKRLVSAAAGLPTIGNVAISIGANGMNNSPFLGRPAVTTWTDNVKATLE